MLTLAHRPFDLSDKVHLSEEQLERLRVIEEYDLWFIAERVKSKGILSEHRVDEALIEFKKYMALVALGHEELGMHSSEVDEVWHSFILFTREYEEFCRKISGRMIHHRPNTSRRPHLPPASVSKFKQAYTTFFGPPPPIWLSRKSSDASADARSPAEGSEILPGDCDVAQDPPKGSFQSKECDSAGMGECDSQGESDDECNTGSDVLI